MAVKFTGLHVTVARQVRDQWHRKKTRALKPAKQPLETTKKPLSVPLGPQLCRILTIHTSDASVARVDAGSSRVRWDRLERSGPRHSLHRHPNTTWYGRNNYCRLYWAGKTSWPSTMHPGHCLEHLGCSDDYMSHLERNGSCGCRSLTFQMIITEV